MNVISIVGQKGGCGKTTMTILLASALAYKYNKKVAALDCDTVQQSLVKIRLRDQKLVMPYEAEEDGKKVLKVNDLLLYKAFKNQKVKAPYKVVRCEERVEPIMKLLVKMDQEGYDYVLLDLPGTVNSDEYNAILSMCNIAFIPFIGDDLNFDSNMAFAKNSCEGVLNSKSNFNLKKVYGYWNRYDKTCRPLEFEEYQKRVREELPMIEMLENKFFATNSAGNSRYMNTLVTPINNYSEYGNITPLIEEMYNKIAQLD